MKSKNGERLHELIREHGLSRQDVADILGVPLNTVHNWLKKTTSPSQRNMSDQMLELLEIKLSR